MSNAKTNAGFIAESISRKTLVPILLFLVVGMAVVITVTQQLSNQAVVNIVVMNTTETTSLIRKHLVEWVKETQQAVQTVASNSRIGESVPDSFMAKILRAGTVDQIKKVKEDNNAYLKISVANTDGNIVMSSVDIEEGADPENVAEEVFFKNAKDDTKLPIMVLNEETGGMNLVFSVPVNDKNGENVGVLIAWIDFTSFESKYLKDLKFGQSGYLSLIDQKTGLVIGIGDWSKRSYIGSIDINNYDWGQTMLQRAATLQEGERDVIYYSWEEEDGSVNDKIATFQPISELGWIITGEAHLDELTEKSDQSTYISLGISLLLLIAISASLVLFLRHLVLNPIRGFTRAIIHAENEGDFSSKSGITTKDEIGRAAKAFDGLMSSLQDSFDNVNRVMSGMANADLTDTIDLEQKGDLGDLKNNINESMNLLNQSMSRLVFLASLIDNGTTELSSSAQALAQGASDQAASLQEISSSMADIASQVNLTNDNAVMASDLSSQTMDIVDNSNKQMEQMLQSMNTINETSQKVTKVIKVIDEIAFQTNLLALNAAVEAARAGKYGKGFAVVAEEVRNLANRSTKAAKETTELIGTSIGEIEYGVKNADQTAAVLNEIQTSVSKVNDLVDDISAASTEQKNGITEINKALDQINSVVMKNSSISEETASSSQELSTKANEMQRLMSRFRIKKQFQDQVEYIEQPVPQIEG